MNNDLVEVKVLRKDSPLVITNLDVIGLQKVFEFSLGKSIIFSFKDSVDSDLSLEVLFESVEVTAELISTRLLIYLVDKLKQINLINFLVSLFDYLRHLIWVKLDQFVCFEFVFGQLFLEVLEVLLGILVLLIFVVVSDPNEHLENLSMEYLSRVEIRMGYECQELPTLHDIFFIRLLVTLKFKDDINDQLNKEYLKQIEAQLVPIRYSCILRVLLLQPNDIGHEIRCNCKEVLYRFRLHMLE